MEYAIKPKEKLNFGLNELWLHRELFLFFTWRDIKVKYKQTVLGFLWAILQPLLMMVIFTLFFGRSMQPAGALVPYPLFVFSGLLMWNIFASSITGAGNSMVANSNIIRKIYFPRLIIPLSSVLVSLFDFLMAFIVYIGLIIYYGHHISFIRVLIYIPAGICLATFSSVGPGMLLAALNAKYRDFRYVIPFLIQALLFLTPVIYPASKFSGTFLKIFFALNPVSAPVTLFRAALSYESIDFTMLLISTLSACFFFISGLLYFRKTESYFADIV